MKGNKGKLNFEHFSPKDKKRRIIV